MSTIGHLIVAQRSQPSVPAVGTLPETRHLHSKRRFITQSAVVVATMFALLITSPAFAAKYKCKRVDSIARLGTPEGSRVTIEDGKKDKETKGRYCAFSINGIAASSPPITRVRQALDRLRAGNYRTGSRLLPDDVAYALIAASPLESPSDDLSKYLKANVSTIHTCIGNYVSISPMDAPSSFTNTISGSIGSCFFATRNRYDWDNADPIGIVPSTRTGRRGVGPDIENPWPFLVIGVGMEIGTDREVRRWFFLPRRPLEQ